jgi:hypothetical protein
MKLKFCFSILSLSIGIALALMPAYSTTITTYSTAASWQAATAAGYQTDTFTGLAPAGGDTAYTSPTGVTASGVEFIGYNSAGSSDIQVVDTSAFTWFNFGSGDALLQSTDRPNSSSPLPYINIVLPASVTALGLNLFTTSPNALSYTITVAGNQYTVPTFSQPTLAFWGITSDTPITSLQLALQGTTYNSSSNELLDNFSFGTAGSDDLSQAPEAGTYLMIGTGLIGLVILRKRMIPQKTRHS